MRGSKTKDIALVVPTIRESCLTEFMKRWKDVGLFDKVDLLVIEDNPTPKFQIPDELQDSYMNRYSWKDIEDDLQEKSWIIPRKSDTVRSYGYWKAWKFGYDYILTLDDDCYPNSEEEGQSFVGDHIQQLSGRGRWYNTLNTTIPRGIPYFNRGKNDKVLVNHGLWTNVLDFDAPRQLIAAVKEEHPYDNRIVPNNYYFPMCGMNVAWKREATVFMYHLLMGQIMRLNGVLEKLPCDRFGDIHCGIIMKKIVDAMGYNVSTGKPYIRHERASNPFTNLKKEANWLEVNEKFWEYVDSWKLFSREDLNFSHVYESMGDHIGKYNEFPEYEEYFCQLGEAMMIWARLFMEKP